MAISKIGVQATGFADANVGLPIPNISLENRAASAANGTIFFNTSNNAIEVYANGAWTGIGSAASGPQILSVTGNFIGFNNQSAVNTTINITGSFGLTQGTLYYVSGGTSDTVTVSPNTTSAITGVRVPDTITALANGTIVNIYFSQDGIESNTFEKELGDPPSGGTITKSGNYRIHTFNSSSNFITPTLFDKTLEYLVVGGGGAGGAGGGGAGGFISGTTPGSGGTFSIQVGGGGATNPFCREFRGANGSNSSFGPSVTAIGGGGGGAYGDQGVSVRTGANGGSGGGGGGLYTNQTNTAGGSGTPGQGNAGGSSSPTVNAIGGGGGGAGAAGQSGSPTNPLLGRGGDGLQWPPGSGTYYAGGGGGSIGSGGPGVSSTPGGQGGGGNGYTGGEPFGGAAGVVNTGGGGGGSRGGSTPGNADSTGGAGGSGIVIVRYTYI